MKNLLNALCVFALVAGVSLFTACANTEKADAATVVAENCDAHKLPIAYVDTDSLIVMYDYAKELEQKLVDKIENDRANLNARVASLAKRQEEFQRKVQNNAFLSQSSAEQQYNELMKEQERLQQEAVRIDSENMQAQQAMLQEISDDIRSYIEEYNKTAGYEVILQKAATIYISSAYDITKEIAEGLNKKKAAKAE
jgi:outer membrane protein